MTVNSQEFQNGEGHFLLALPRQLVSPSPPPLYHVVQRSPSPVYMMAHHQLSRSSLCILVSSVTHPALLVAGLCFGLCSSLVACVCCLDSPTNQPRRRKTSTKVANIIPSCSSSVRITQTRLNAFSHQEIGKLPATDSDKAKAAWLLHRHSSETSSSTSSRPSLNSHRETGLNIRPASSPQAAR